jgi:RpiR family glv operon transcriptional regulator
MFAGCMCTAREDWDTLYHMAQNLTEDDLAIIVSSSGETSRIIEFAQTLKGNRTRVISIIGRDDSTLEGISDLTLRGSVASCYYGEIDMSSRFLLSIVLDLLVLTYMHEN